MELNRETVLRRLEQATLWLTIGAAAVGIVLLALRVLVHFPFFDESVHVRYLWMISAGLKPGADFYATYPVFSYFFVAPLLKILPDSAYTLLPLRFLCVAAFAATGVLLIGHGKRVAGDWMAGLFPLVLLAASGNIGPFLVEFSIDHFAALLAVGAMVLFFRPPKPANVAAACALCLLSVAITPKYAFPLFFGVIGFIGSVWLADREAKKLMLSVIGGSCAAALFVILVYAVYGTSLAENIKTAHIVTSRHALAIPGPRLVLDVLANIARRPFLGAILLLGIAGWAKRSWGKKDAITLAGAGILLGVLLFSLKMRTSLEQYQTPVYLSLAVFSPFAFASFGQKPSIKMLRALFAAAVLVVALNQIWSVRGEFRETNFNRRDTENRMSTKVPGGLTALAGFDDILKKIPRGEKVAAIWAHHPMFRMDVTGMTVDDRPSHAIGLDPGDPDRRFFDPAYLRGELQKRPPALIDLFFMDNNYPPGWDGVVKDYLSKNMNLYQPVPSPVLKGWFFYMRKDLLNR